MSTDTPQIRPLGQTPVARLVLAKGLFERGRFKQAAQEVDLALADNPELAEGHFLRGIIQTRQADPGAVASLEQCLKLDPKQMSAYVVLVHIHLDRRDGAAALAVADRGVEVDEQNDRAHFGRGEALYMLERKEEAVAALRDSIRLNPQFVPARYKLGMILVELGRDDEAFPEVVAAERMTPGNFNNRIALGDLLLARNQHDEALREYRAAADLQLLHPVPHARVGALLRKEGLSYEAIVSYRTALRIDAKHVDSFLALAGLYLEQDWLREAREFAQAAVELKPNLDEALELVRKIDEAREAKLRAPAAPLAAEDLPQVALELIERVHHEYSEARRDCGESVEGLTLERVSLTLRREVSRIQQRYPDSEVDFRVLVRDGKARILARRAEND